MADDFKQLEKRIEALERLLAKDNFSNLQIFRKKIQFLNKTINIKNLTTSPEVTGDLYNSSGTVKIA